MQKCESGLTVYFEDPYWVGVYERCTGGQLTVCKIVFHWNPFIDNNNKSIHSLYFEVFESSTIMIQ